MVATEPSTSATAGLGFADTLVRLAHLVDRVFAETSRDHDLTPQQAQLLCLLINGPVGMGELGQMLHLEKSSLSGLVDRVSRRGLAQRVQDQRDRRACKTALTDAGKRAGRGVHDAVVARLESLASEVSPDDRHTLRAIGAGLLEAGDQARLDDASTG